MKLANMEVSTSLWMKVLVLVARFLVRKALMLNISRNSEPDTPA
jgi:hypothetical protein